MGAREEARGRSRADVGEWRRTSAVCGVRCAVRGTRCAVAEFRVELDEKPARALTLTSNSVDLMDPSDPKCGAIGAVVRALLEEWRSLCGGVRIERTVRRRSKFAEDDTLLRRNGHGGRSTIDNGALSGIVSRRAARCSNTWQAK